MPEPAKRVVVQGLKRIERSMRSVLELREQADDDEPRKLVKDLEALERAVEREHREAQRHGRS